MRKIVFLLFFVFYSFSSADTYTYNGNTVQCGLVPYLDITGNWIDGYYWVDCPPSGSSGYGVDAPQTYKNHFSVPSSYSSPVGSISGSNFVSINTFSFEDLQILYDALSQYTKTVFSPITGNSYVLSSCDNDYILFSPESNGYLPLCNSIQFSNSNIVSNFPTVTKIEAYWTFYSPNSCDMPIGKNHSTFQHQNISFGTLSRSQYTFDMFPKSLSSATFVESGTTKMCSPVYDSYKKYIVTGLKVDLGFLTALPSITLDNIAIEYYDSGALCSSSVCRDFRLYKRRPPCPTGFFRDGSSCVSKCSQNESWDEDTQTCGCIPGTNKMPSGLCANCPIGQDSDAAGNCLPACPSGWHSQLVGDGSNICVQDGYTSGSTSSGVAVRELDPVIYSGGGKMIYNPDGSSTMVNSSGQITQNCDTSALCTPVTSTSPSIYVASTGLVVGGFLVTSAGALTVPFDTSISTPVIAAGLGMIYSGLGLAGYTFYQDTMGNPINPTSTAEKKFVMDISNFNTGGMSGGSSGSSSSGSVMGTSGDVTTYSTSGSNGSRMIVQVNSQTGEVVGFATKANSDEIEKVVHFNASPNDPNNLAPDSSKVIEPIVVSPSSGSTATGTVTWVWPDGTVESYTFEPQTNTYTKSPVSSTNTNDGSTSGGSTSGGSTSGGTTSGGSTSGGTTSGGSTSGGSTSGGTTSGGSTSGGTSSGTGTSTGTGTSSGTGTTDGSGTSTGTGTGSGGSMGDGQTSGAAGTDTGSGDTTAGNSDFGSGFGDFDSFPNWQDFTDKLKSFTDDAKNKFSSVGQSVADAKDAMKNGIETKPISSGSGCNLYISTKFGSADLANSIDRVAVVFNPVITVLLTILFMWLQIMFFIKVYMFKGNS